MIDEFINNLSIIFMMSPEVTSKVTLLTMLAKMLLCPYILYGYICSFVNIVSKYCVRGQDSFLIWVMP